LIYLQATMMTTIQPYTVLQNHCVH